MSRRHCVPSVVVATVLLVACVSCSFGSSSAASSVSDPAQPAGTGQKGAAPVSNNRNSFPTADDTGPSGELAPYKGPLIIRTPDTVIENVEIVAPYVRVAADNVTFRNVRFVYSGGLDETFALIAVDRRFRGTVFEDCEIDGRNGTARAVTGAAGVTVRRCDIHNTGNAVEVQNNFTVEQSYFHDIFTPPGLSWHSDGIQASNQGVENIRIVNNTIILTGPETGAVHVNSATGTSRNVLIAGNLLGGGGYTMYVGAANSENFVVADNAFTTETFPNIGWFGTWYPSHGNVEARGNFVLGSGAATSPPW